MDIEQPLTLLGGLSAAQFMQRYWHKKPLLVRAAIPGFAPLLTRSELFALATRDGVESRLIERRAAQWRLRPGPFAARTLPPRSRPDWTLLVQGVDLHVAAARQLLRQFCFVPEARLDDLMVSYATEGGGVGPHFDSYDVFLLQAQGQRRWRIGRQRKLDLIEGAPLKVLRDFQPQQEYTLSPGDMLYLPPRWAHEGVALDECQTYSIGFRAPRAAELAGALLDRVAEAVLVDLSSPSGASSGRRGSTLYRDPQQQATATPAALPDDLQRFAVEAVQTALRTPRLIERALGEYLSEPKPQVWFEPSAATRRRRMQAVTLDPRSRMLYDRAHIYLNGESWRAAGRDATLLRRLADQRGLSARDIENASSEARSLLDDWLRAGWLHSEENPDHAH